MNDTRITATTAAFLGAAALGLGVVAGLVIGLAVTPAVRVPDSLTIDLASPRTLALEGLPETPLSIPGPVALGGGKALIVAKLDGASSLNYYVVSVHELAPGMDTVKVERVQWVNRDLTVP